jgi:hypothetical protein
MERMRELNSPTQLLAARAVTSIMRQNLTGHKLQQPRLKNQKVLREDRKVQSRTYKAATEEKEAYHEALHFFGSNVGQREPQKLS